VFLEYSLISLANCYSPKLAYSFTNLEIAAPYCFLLFLVLQCDLYRARNPTDHSGPLVAAHGTTGSGQGLRSTGGMGGGLLRGLGADLESSRIKKLEKLIKKRL